jgi:ubiquinone/menaquinone biosynthesis C-methylase UbiE
MEQNMICIEFYKPIKGRGKTAWNWRTVMAYAVPRIGETISIDEMSKKYLVKSIWHDFNPNEENCGGVCGPHRICVTVEKIKEVRGR